LFYKRKTAIAKEKAKPSIKGTKLTTLKKCNPFVDMCK
jgi:hypothetical protein